MKSVHKTSIGCCVGGWLPVLGLYLIGKSFAFALIFASGVTVACIICSFSATHGEKL